MENTVEQLPQIIARMESLQLIHEESAKIINKINRITESQNAVLKNLEENQGILKKVRVKFILGFKLEIRLRKISRPMLM